MYKLFFTHKKSLPKESISKALYLGNLLIAFCPVGFGLVSLARLTSALATNGGGDLAVSSDSKSASERDVIVKVG